MRYWCICKTMQVDEGGEIATVPVINRYTQSSQIISYESPVWVLCAFAADSAQIDTIDGDADIEVLFAETDLTKVWGDFSAADRGTINGKLSAAGFETGAITLDMPVTGMLLYLGQQIDVNIVSVAFAISDIWQ